MSVRGHARLLLAAICAVWIAGCGKSESASAPPSAKPVAVPAPSFEPVDLALQPVVTFDEVCARCHGPGAMFHIDRFAGLPDGKLASEVRRMMVGPGQLEPTDAEVDVMIAYHRALGRRELFVSISNGGQAGAGSAGELRGEQVGADSIEVRKGQQVHVADIDGDRWSLANPPSPPFEIVAKRGEITVGFEFPKAQWTHASP